MGGAEARGPAPSVFDVMAELDRPGPEATVETPPQLGPELVIEVEYRVGGELKHGVFVYRVPSVAERRRIDVLAASLLRGVPRHSFSDEALAGVARDAYLAVTVRDWPAWCPSPDDFHDPRLLNQVFERAVRHEARFLGRFGDPSAGPGAAGDADARGHGAGLVGSEVGAAEPR